VLAFERSYEETGTTHRQIFSFLENVHMVMIVINQSFPTDLAMRKVNQISFSILNLFLVQVSSICIWLGILECYVK